MPFTTMDPADVLSGKAGTTGWATDVATNLNFLNSAKLPRGYISGLLFSNNAGDGDHDVDFTAGVARYDDDSDIFTLAVALTKLFDLAFAKGNNGGALGPTVALPASGTMHFFAITEDSTGDADIYGDTDPAGANNPVGWTVRRRVGAFRTDASSNFIRYSTLELRSGAVRVERLVYAQDISEVIGTTLVLKAIGVPAGFEFVAEMDLRATRSNTRSTATLISASATSAGSPTIDIDVPGSGATSTTISGTVSAKTNTSSQIKVSSGSASGTTVNIAMRSYVDERP